MASYRIVIRRSAEEELMAVPFPFRRQINGLIFKLKKDPRPSAAERIAEGEHFRLRVDGWRVVYEVEDESLVVTIIAIVR